MFVWPGFGDGVDCRGDFCEKIPEASPSSTMDVLLANSNTGSTSVIAYLRKSEKYCTTAGGRVECKYERSSSADTQERQELLQALELRFP